MTFCTDTRTQCFTPISIHLSLAQYIIKAKSFTAIKKIQDFIQVSRMGRIMVVNPKEKGKKRRKKRKARPTNLLASRRKRIFHSWKLGENFSKVNFQIATSCGTSCLLFWSSWCCLLPAAEDWPSSTLGQTCSGNSPCPIYIKVEKGVCCHTKNHRQICFKRQGYPFLLPWWRLGNRAADIWDFQTSQMFRK